jgi:hypothetical protein
LLPWSAQLAALPLRDPSAAYEPASNPHECSCDYCTERESLSNLSPVGWAFTCCATYSGFGALAAAVLWNANIAAQLRKVRREWAALRAGGGAGAV